MQQHYFIGVKIPVHFGDLVAKYKEKYRFHKFYKVIPHIEDLHVTLLYLGAVSNDNLSSLTLKLREIADGYSQFPMNVDGLSYFGSSSGPRVIYLSIRESAELKSLQNEIASSVSKQIGLPVSDRFIPHITIAKKRKNTDKLFIEKETYDPIEVLVDGFSLFTIHPKKSPKYEAIKTFKHRVPGTHTT